MNYKPKKERKKVSSLRKPSSTKAFPHRGAGGSLRRGVYTRDGEASADKVEASLDSAIVSLGKEKKEPRLFFTPTFNLEKSGFYSFVGFKLRVVDAKKGGSR